MKALSILQPWASLIASGVKDVENRGWNPPKELVGQRFVVHASKRLDPGEVEAAECVAAEAGIVLQRPESGWPLGAALGTVVLLGWGTVSGSPWFQGSVGFALGDAELWERPVPIRGQLGFWEFPSHLLPAGCKR